jgi:hypothetical protein
VVTRTCAGCGTEFDARANAAYCSSACRQRAYRNRNAAKRRVTASADTPPRPIGRPNVKRQLRVLEYVSIQLDGLAHGMEGSFSEGRFEKTCTPEVAAEYAYSLSDSLRRIRKMVRVLRDHGRRG